MDRRRGPQNGCPRTPSPRLSDPCRSLPGQGVLGRCALFSVAGPPRTRGPGRAGHRPLQFPGWTLSAPAAPGSHKVPLDVTDRDPGSCSRPFPGSEPRGPHAHDGARIPTRGCPGGFGHKAKLGLSGGSLTWTLSCLRLSLPFLSLPVCPLSGSAPVLGPPARALCHFLSFTSVLFKVSSHIFWGLGRDWAGSFRRSKNLTCPWWP